MARPTDTERGARIALGIAVMRAVQPDLFGDQPHPEFWNEIAEHARDQLDELDAYRMAQPKLFRSRRGYVELNPDGYLTDEQLDEIRDDAYMSAQA